MPKGEIICRTTVSGHMAGATTQAKVGFDFRTNEAANTLCHFQDYQEGAGHRRAHAERMIPLVEGT